MEHAKRLYLVDEFDRVYKQLQRPSAAVAKTHSSIQLSKTLLDVSQHLVDSHNSTNHRSIGMPPDKVSVDTDELVRSRHYPQKYSGGRPRLRYNVGDTVRIAMSRHSPFVKCYTDKWTRELFEIGSRLPTVPPTYALKDMSGESIKGKFYEQELQKVTERPVSYTHLTLPTNREV